MVHEYHLHANGKGKLMQRQAKNNKLKARKAGTCTLPAPIVAVVAAVAMSLPMGCASTPQAEGPLIKFPPSGERLAEAIRLTAMGERAQSEGDDDAAMALYKEATTLSSDAPSAAWNNLGMLYMEQKDYLQAKRYLSTASQLAPLDPQPMYNLGLAYHNAGWDRQALDSFLLALDREPNYIPAIRGAATAAMRLRLTDEDALDRLKHALLVERDPTWRGVFERERLAMQSRLEIENR